MLQRVTLRPRQDRVLIVVPMLIHYHWLVKANVYVRKDLFGAIKFAAVVKQMEDISHRMIAYPALIWLDHLERSLQLVASALQDIYGVAKI